MKIVIVGGGDVGVSVISRLVRGYSGLHITVVDLREDVCRRISRRFREVKCVVGDGTDPHVLEDAGIRGANVFLALTGDGRVNIVSAMLAKIYEVERIIVRVDNEVLEELARKLGIKCIVNPAKSAAIQVDLLLKSPGMTDLIEMARRDVDMLEVRIDEKSPYINMKLEDTDLFRDDNTVPVLIYRGNNVILPKPYVRIKPNDRILLIRKSRGLLGHLLY